MQDAEMTGDPFQIYTLVPFVRFLTLFHILDKVFRAKSETPCLMM